MWQVLQRGGIPAGQHSPHTRDKVTSNPQSKTPSPHPASHAWVFKVPAVWVRWKLGPGCYGATMGPPQELGLTCPSGRRCWEWSCWWPGPVRGRGLNRGPPLASWGTGYRRSWQLRSLSGLLQKALPGRAGPVQLPVGPPWTKASHGSVWGMSADGRWFGAEWAALV